jgi:hypothetical protein
MNASDLEIFNFARLYYQLLLGTRRSSLLISAMIIVHSGNSTAQPEWHPNAVQRGTWAIYQTCIITIVLCVWTTIHLNVPRPGEKTSKQIWRRIGWSLLAIIAPEVVALNAW